MSEEELPLCQGIDSGIRCLQASSVRMLLPVWSRPGPILLSQVSDAGGETQRRLGTSPLWPPFPLASSIWELRGINGTNAC